MHELTEQIKRHQKELDELMRRKMPVVAGRMAKDHFQDNFRRGGFVDNGFSPWQPAKRLSDADGSASSRYGTLLSSRNHLFSSINYVPAPYSVALRNNVPYASVHNEGGTLSPTVTPKMRKYAWMRFYKANGGKSAKRKDGAEKGGFWKALALTKKSKLKIMIPRRRFMGESAELSAKMTKRMKREIANILKQ